MAKTQTAVAKQPEESKPKTARGMVQAMRDRIAQVLPAHMNADQVVQGVLLALAQNNDLLACNPDSVVFAVMAASRIGLELNSPLQHAWLIPYKAECTLMIGYRGYQELARRGGQVRNVEARAVFKGDEFEYALGSAPFIKHKPAGNTKPEDLTHAYALAFFKEGGAPIIEVLTRSEIDAARKVSRSGMVPEGPWSRWYAEMARKSAVRRLAKYLPLSPEMAAAIEMDIRGETGEIQTTSTIIDSPESVNDQARERTAARLEELKNGMEGQSPKAGGSQEPGATATAPPPAAPAETGRPPF